MPNLLGKCSKPLTRNQSPFKFVVLVICNLHLIFLVKFGLVIFKFGRLGSFAKMTFENYVEFSD